MVVSAEEKAYVLRYVETIQGVRRVPSPRTSKA